MSHRLKRTDDLPLYPTPQQAAYVIPGNEPARSLNQNGKSSSYRPANNQANSQASNQYAHLQPSVSYGQDSNYNAPTPQQYYQPPVPQHQPPQQQQQHQSHQSHQSHQQSHQPIQQQYQQYQQPPRQQVQQSQHRPSPQQHHSYTHPAPQQQQHQPQHQQQQHSQQPQHSQQYQHTDQQSINSFNQLRISPQPKYLQHSNPSQNQNQSHPQQSQPSSYSTRLASASSSSSNLQKKPPPVDQKVKLEQELKLVFEKVDKNGSGKISARELSYALINFDNTKFRDSTIILMIKLFSTNPKSNSLPSKLLNFDQFVNLWKHLASYKKLFMQADIDNSGDVSFGEFQNVLKEVGYKLNIDLALHLFQKFSYKNLDEFDAGITVGKLKFDSFVELLVYLKKLTDVFKKYDKEKIGVSTIGFSDFLFEVSNLT